jgi:hypothetical protein
MSAAALSQIEALFDQLTPEEQLKALDRLNFRLHEVPAGHELPPGPLRGILKGRVPEDFDIDAALHEIRTEWLKELDEFFPEAAGT